MYKSMSAEKAQEYFREMQGLLPGNYVRDYLTRMAPAPVGDSTEAAATLIIVWVLR